MMPREYRQLLPAPQSESRSTSEPSSTASGQSEDRLKRKRVGVQVACNLCRAKKTRCDGGRPVCGVCRKKGIEKCTYNEKREVNDEVLEVIELLKTSPEPRATEMLRLIRVHGDHSVILALARNTPDDNQQPSPSTSDQDEALRIKSSMESELMSKNPVTFPGLRSLSLTGLEQSHLLRPIDPASGVSSELQDGMDSDSAVRLFRGPKSPSGSPNKYRELCDDRLANLSVSFWTSVQIPNDLAAKAISMYLETDHPLLGTFEPTQFVGDLVNHQQTSCSPFLANCVLYWGCQMYSAIDKRLNDYAKDFGKESERLWDIVKSSDSSLNMIGAQMLSLAYMGNGKDHKVLKYQLEAVKMGARLGLLGVDRKTAEARLRKLPQSHLVAYSYAAWGVFNWAVLVSIFYRQPGVLHLRFPPTLPIPGTSGQYDPISSHPIVQDALPEYMGYTFPAICEFWQIVREVSLAYFAQGKDPSDNVPLNFAEMKYREILAWAENLPVQITRDSNCPHHVVIFHMWIHATILDIFRPFMKQGYANSQRLRTFSAADSTPDAAFKASVNQLKQLIFDYRSSYESSAYTILWQTALTYLATSVLQDTADPSWRPWFMLCIYGYETLRRPYRVAEAIGGGLLTMTMRDTDITTEDARKILNDLKYRGLTAPVDEEIRATFMGDLNMAIKNPEGARMENLAKAFEEVALLKDYTHGIEDTEMD